MPSLNRCFFIGNLTKDPDVTYTPKGIAVTTVGLAVNRSWKDEQGNKQEEVTFLDITLFGRQAEIAGQYLKKGQPAFIEGRLQLSTWEENGVKRSKLRVIGENLQLLARREGAETGPAPPPDPRLTFERPTPSPAATQPRRPSGVRDEPPDKIPY
jgi:single-strand DNA-binding protein